MYPTETLHPKRYPYTSIMASPYSCDPTGTLDCAASIEQLKADQSNTGTLHVPQGSFRISTNLTFPSGMFIRAEAGATFIVSTGITVTVNCNFDSPIDEEMFVLEGTGTVVFNIPVLLGLGKRTYRYGTYTFNTNTTINDDVIIEPGAILHAANGATITINGPIEAGPYQIFSCAGTGKVVFGTGYTKELLPQWWGDLSTDGTAAIQACLTCSKDSGIKVRFINGNYPISGALTYVGYCIQMDSNAFIVPTGSGYTALTITRDTAYKSYDDWRINIAASQASPFTGNGLHWVNPGGISCSHIAANFIDGSAVAIDYPWDCVFNSISIQESGNSSNYAFSLNDAIGTDPTYWPNNSVFGHIQAESSISKSIYISPLTINSRIDLIHGEAVTSPSGYSWVFGGVGCDYGNIYIDRAAGVTNASLLINGSGTQFGASQIGGTNEVDITIFSTYSTSDAENSTPTNIFGYAGLIFNGWKFGLNNPVNIGAASGDYANPFGRVTFNTCKVRNVLNIYNHIGRFVAKNCSIIQLKFADAQTNYDFNYNEGLNTFDVCDIDTVLTYGSPNTTGFFRDCNILHAQDGRIAGITTFHGGVIGNESPGTTIWYIKDSETPSGKAINTTFRGDIKGAFPNQIGFLKGCKIIGNIEKDSSGTNNWYISETTVSGTIDNAFLQAPVDWSAPLGGFHQNLSPSELGSGGSKYTLRGWRCTVAGTGLASGTWVEERCLTGN